MKTSSSLPSVALLASGVLSGIGCLAVMTLPLINSLPAYASCYGRGSMRYCDGIGGPGATYSPVDKNGTTIYYGKGGTIKSVTRRDASIGDLQIQIIETTRF